MRGCDLLMICSNCSVDSIGGIDRAAADLRVLAEHAQARRRPGAPPDAGDLKVLPSAKSSFISDQLTRRCS
jgi:hypothetical protein